MNKQSINEVRQALFATGLSYSNGGNEAVGYMTSEYDVSHLVAWCEALAKKIIATNEELFSIKTNKVTSRKYIHKSKLGGEIFSLLNRDVGNIKLHFPFHQFNPYVDIFLRNAEIRQLSELFDILKHPTDDEVVQCVDHLNGFVDAIKRECNGSKFNKILSDFKRASNKNYRQLLLYIKSLFENNSRLLILRIDFGYKKAMGWPNGQETSVTYNEVKGHRDALIKYLAKEMPNDCLVGYAWKLEYGLDKSYHIHSMIFLDGSKVREDVTIARMIGEHWSKGDGITEGKGLYFNCNAFKQSYKSCGIGMASHDDAEMQEGLRKAALYMTKPDYYIRMVAPENGRTFGKGIMPKIRINKLGRPRSKGESMDNNI